MEIPNAADGTDVAIPAWNALYQIRDFAYRISDVRVNGTPPSNIATAIRRLDKQTWRIGLSSPTSSALAKADIAIEYSTEWDDSGPFNSQLNERHAFINFAEILMYVPDRRNEDTEVAFENVPSDWRVVSELAAARGKSSFAASSYDALVDAPTEAGKFEEFAFDMEGDSIFESSSMEMNGDKGRLENYLRHITDYELHLTGRSSCSSNTHSSFLISTRTRTSMAEGWSTPILRRLRRVQWKGQPRSPHTSSFMRGM